MANKSKPACPKCEKKDGFETTYAMGDAGFVILVYCVACSHIVGVLAKDSK